MVLQSKRIGRFFMIGVYDYTVIATYLSLLLGLGGLYSAAQNEPLDAMLCLMLAGLLDAFDGRIARTKKDRTEQEKRFGIQIDSLNDLVCFGVLPAAIGWSMDCDRLWFLATMSFFALCALIRLAYFNVTEELRQQETDECRKTYTGLPITSAALIFPFFFCFLDIFQRAAILHGALLVVMALTGASFVMPFHIRKPRSKEQWALLGIGLVIAAGCIFVWVRFRMRIVR